MSRPDFFYRIGFVIGRVIQAKDLGSMIYGKIDTNIDMSIKRNDEL